MMKKRIAIIGTAGIPARYGGFETLASQLAIHLHKEFDLTVYCSRKYYTREERKIIFPEANLVYLPLSPNGYQSIFYDLWSFIHALFNSEVLFVLGTSGALFFPLIRLLTYKKIIVHIDGQEWKRDRWNKCIRSFLKLSERCAVKFAHSVVTDHLLIQSHVEKHYGKLASLIGYGGDHAGSVEPNNQDSDLEPFTKLVAEKTQNRYAIAVGRIVPENNFEIIFKAFKEMPRSTIIAIGNWSSSQYGRNLRKKYKDYENLVLLDPVYEQKPLDLLRSNAFVYIHGHRCGGTNPSLVEAMHLGLPVIAHDNPFNRGTTEKQAFYFSNENDLTKILETNSLEALQACGDRMRSIAHERMRWEDVVKKYSILFSNQ